jgi:type II secretory pathway pseudopilin PulG
VKITSRRIANAFSLVEVVLALGVVSFAIVAILGILPVGLNTGHAAQDETRAAQIAEDILASLAAQAPANFNNTSIQQPSGFQFPVPLNQDKDYPPLGASNDGTLNAAWAPGMPYQITLSTKTTPTGFDPGYACQVSVRVAWQPFNQNYRDYLRIISKY